MECVMGLLDFTDDWALGSAQARPQKLYSFDSHEDEVLHLAWSPYNPTVFASASVPPVTGQSILLKNSWTEEEVTVEEAELEGQGMEGVEEGNGTSGTNHEAAKRKRRIRAILEAYSPFRSLIRFLGTTSLNIVQQRQVQIMNTQDFKANHIVSYCDLLKDFPLATQSNIDYNGGMATFKMSALKMQESVFDDEVTQLRRHACLTENHVSTLENELLKKNKELIQMRETLNDALTQFRNETARVVALESELTRRAEDLRSERCTRQNMEAMLDATKEKLNSEHEQDIKRLQSEKSTLESRLRALESQVQANKPPQIPSRLPRSTTFSAASSTVNEARIATLESNLSKATLELEEAQMGLATTRQEASKVSRLQTDLIVAENARMRAENVAKAKNHEVEAVNEKLREQEEELEYWRNEGGDKSIDAGALEDALRERDEALKREGALERREAALLKRMHIMEEKEAELVMDREEALNEVDELRSMLSSGPGYEEASTVSELRNTLIEREAALSKVREYAAELQQVYHATRSACEDAKARVEELERQLQPSNKDTELPLIIVSPPPSRSPSVPALVQPRPTMSSEDEAAVGRLLTAIERLRSERDSLRRELHFANIEHHITHDTLKAGLQMKQSEVLGLKEDVEELQGQLEVSEEKLRQHQEEAQVLLQTRGTPESTERITEITSNVEEMQIMRTHIEELEASIERSMTSHAKMLKMTAASFIVVQHISSDLDQATESGRLLADTHEELVLSCNELKRSNDEALRSREQLQGDCLRLRADLDDAIRAREELVLSCGNLARSRDDALEARDRFQGDYVDAICTRDAALETERTLREELAGSETRLADAIQLVEKRDAQILDMRQELQELQIEVSSLQYALAEAREEKIIAENRNSPDQFSGFSDTDDNAVTTTLRSQIEILEQRVLRRTEQIGMLQHDSKRLETNLRVAEETIAELTAELETLGQERACLLEDCAQARAARDEAHRKIEELEVEVEMLGPTRLDNEQLQQSNVQLQRDLQVARIEANSCDAATITLIHLVTQSVSKSRALSSTLQNVTTQLSFADAQRLVAHDQYSQTLLEMERLKSELDSAASLVQSKMDTSDVLSQQLASAQENNRSLSAALEELKMISQERQHTNDQEIRQLTTTTEDLEMRLQAAQDSEALLSQQLQMALRTEEETRRHLEQIGEDSQPLAKEAERLSSVVASLQADLAAQRTSHSDAIAMLQNSYERETASLRTEIEQGAKRLLTLHAEHTDVTRDLTQKLEAAQSHFEAVNQTVLSYESLESDIRRLKSEHAEELLILRSHLDESNGESNVLQAQLQAVTDTIAELESEIEAVSSRYEAAQVEIRGLENTLSQTRLQLEEQDVLIRTLQREKLTMQLEHKRLDAELDKMTVKYQFAEQQVKRSDHEVAKLKADVDIWRNQAVKLDDTKQQMEVDHAVRINHFTQVVAKMERELEKEQSHRKCEDSMSEFKEKIEYLEEMLRMKAVEIEENDDRFIEVLKERKRLTNKVDSLSRKVLNLQAKLGASSAVPATATASSSPTVPPVTAPPITLPTLPRPKTPSPIPSRPSMLTSGPSDHPPSRIPSSPGFALRAKTPDRLRSGFHGTTTPESSMPPPHRATHQNTPEPNSVSRIVSSFNMLQTTNNSTPVSIPSLAPSTPLRTTSKKRRVPDDFETQHTPSTAAIFGAGENLTPRQFQRPTTDSRGFTPTRSQVPPPRPPSAQASPLRKTTVPLAESTNSPRGSKAIGLGRPTSVTNPPTRSWLSRSRAPTGTRGDIRSMSVMDTRPI
ncbi:hypothetical protein BU17DRAFT_67745 [Hysterangium stoloniferum]|nr:hypothetical protein BU17DRAFT_67745 [Hysterangium stoloniferum]